MNVSLAGAVSVHRAAANGLTTINTIVPGDTLLLNSVGLSCTSDVLALGSSNVGATTGISVGNPATSSNSLLWHNAGAGASLCATGGTATTRWELVGGDLRVTRIQSNVGTVSYALRIADDDSLQIFQTCSNVGGTSFHRRVARFGGW